MPRGLEWKVRALGRLNGRILERARFMDLALRSVEDGLIIAGPDGRITYANRRAAAILGSSDHTLIGRDLFKRLAEAEGGREVASAGRERLERLLVDRAKIEREIAVGDIRPQRYILRLAAVSASDESGSLVLGIVASLSDITRQYELQQTKNDVVALVSHEMRTPLTAIQGMSELLANYDLDPGRRREMNLAINDEAKRLTRMIGEYLDIARLESGATVLRRVPLRVEALLDRTLLLLEPIATQRGIRLDRRFSSHLPVLLADGDLLSRAVSNLVSNAIKYSPPETAVSISAVCDSGGVSIAVADQGYGIPASDLERIFEKFYRTPRAEDADVSGTGLGLALVRDVAELHGGAVTVKSAVGSGSTFTLRIPRAGTKE
jgi:PAS domain S-box-containing protein